MTGSHLLIQSLLKENVEVIFGYPGGAIMPVYDALYDYKDKINHILVRHEQGAAHAAEGYARIKGKAGVCMATSGPGATNLVTGIADAMMDSVPLVCITGQVTAALLGTDAFQEVDIIGITAPITKWNYQITKASEIPEIIEKAFAIAQNGRPGPVLIDITKNAQVEQTHRTPSNSPLSGGEQASSLPDLFADRQDKGGLGRVLSGISTNPIPEKTISQAATLLNSAKKPYMLIGHGVLISKAEKEVKTFIEKTGIPVASTVHGLSAIPTSHPLYVGMLGMHGNYGANVLTNQADVIIAVGMRFDDRVTGDLKKYARQATVIHIDIDAAEIHKNVTAHIPIQADAKTAFEALLPHVEKNNHSEWLKEFRKYDDIEYKQIIKQETHPSHEEMTMAEVVNLLSEKTKGEAIIVADVGQHQMIAARYSKFNQTDSFITSGGLGTMGFALPAAIGAKTANPKREVIAIIGDGGFQMNMQELTTLAQENLGVKIIILNNNFLGMVRQWQELFFEKRYSFVNMFNPDFVAVAKGCYVDGQTVNKREELSNSLDTMLHTEKPYLLNIMVMQENNIFPMIPAGAGIEEIRLK